MTGTGGLVRTMALRHLRERPLRTALTAAGIAAGVALVFSISAMNASLNQTIEASVKAFAGPADLQATAITTGTIHGGVVDRIRAVDGVTAAAPILQARSTLRAEGRAVDAFVLGTTADLAAFVPTAGTTRGAGATSAPAGTTRATSAATSSGVAISRALASRLHVDAGDRLVLDTPSRPVEVPIEAVLDDGPLDRIDGGMVAVLPLPIAQATFERPDEVDLVLVDVAQHRVTAEVQRGVREAVGTAAVVTRPADAPGAQSENVQPFLALTSGLGAISLFVALVLVTNTMTMAMAERRQEVALAAALGARRRQLFLATLGEALLLGIAGTALGLVGGALLAGALVHAAGTGLRVVLPIDPPSGPTLLGPHLLTAALGGVAVSVLGAVLPARRVLQTAPIGALRPADDYEWAPDDAPRRRWIPLAAGTVLLCAALFALSTRDHSPSMGEGVVNIVALLCGMTVLLPSALPSLTERIARLLERRWVVTGRLAGDALRANPRRTSITLATLILPLATVIGMGTAFSSAQARFHHLANTFITGPIAVESTSFEGYTARQPLAPSTMGLIESVPGVEAALPKQNVFLNTDDGLAIVYVTPESMAQAKGVPDGLRDSSLADDPAAFREGLRDGGIVVSRLAARDRGLRVGGHVTLPSVDGPVRLRVAAEFTDLAGIDSFFIDRDTFLRHWTDDRASGFGVSLLDGADRTEVEHAIAATLREHGIPARVVDRGESVRALESKLSGLFSMSRMIQLAALLVAGLSLTSTAFTTVLERRWTLGLQRTLGMSRRQIARSLALEAAAIALIGGIVAGTVGIAMGVLLGQGFSLISGSPLPITIPWPVVGACAVGALVLSLLATAYPRRLAIRTEIIDALVTE